MVTMRNPPVALPFSFKQYYGDGYMLMALSSVDWFLRITLPSDCVTLFRELSFGLYGISSFYCMVTMH